MTRKKHDIEQAVETLGDNRDSDDEQYGPRIVYEKDGQYFAEDGDLAPTDEDGEPLPSRTGTTVILDGEYASPNGAEWGHS